jgi:hypothetical protein
MKLTTSQLKKIIAEEVKKTLSEGQSGPLTMQVTFKNNGGELHVEWNNPAYNGKQEGSVGDMIDHVKAELGILPPLSRGAFALTL